MRHVVLIAGAALAVACGPAAKTAARASPAEGMDAGTTPVGAADAGTTQVQIQLRAPEAGRLYHGVLPEGTTEPDSDISAANLDAYERTTGRRVAYVYFSQEWLRSRLFPAHTAGWIRDRGAVPFIRLMMRSQRRPLVTDPVFTLDRIIAGEFDADLSAWADQARAFGPLVVEYGTEVNGDWNVWSAPYNGGLDIGPEKFKRAYRHIVQLMRARGATNITWALHYNSQNYPEDPRNVPASYYPGDDVVDWVGISAYGSERSTDHRCPTFRSLVDDMLPQLRAATAVRPLFIFEFGNTSNNPGCPAGPWVQAALGDLLSGRWPDVRGFCWWNERWNDNGAAGTDMLVQDDPSVGAAFFDALHGPHASSVVDAPLLQ
jgi:hypothetical protein